MENKIIASFKPEELDMIDNQYQQEEEEEINGDDENINGGFFQDILNIYI